MSQQAEGLSGSESTLLRSLVFIEGILRPLQVALFALALCRMSMRAKVSELRTEAEFPRIRDAGN